MKFVISKLAALVVSVALPLSVAFAQETAEKNDEPVRQDDAIFHHVPQNMQDSFAFNVFVQGVSSQTGYGLAIESPFAWDAFSLRLGISSDSTTSRRGHTMGFYTAQVALKAQFDLMSSANLYPYILIGYNHYMGINYSVGSKHSTEALFGADWRFVSTPVFRKDIRIVRSFFIEAGAVRSDLVMLESDSGVAPARQIGDGFMGRIGFRTFL